MTVTTGPELFVGAVIQIESHPDKYFRIEELDGDRINKLSRPYKDAGCRMPWKEKRGRFAAPLARLNTLRTPAIAR